MMLKNVNNCAGTYCACGSWLNHWYKFSGRAVPIYCPVDGCMYTDLIGAHVQKADGNDKNWYIAPLCVAHSQSRNVMEYPDWCAIVPANKHETCERGG